MLVSSIPRPPGDTLLFPVDETVNSVNFIILCFLCNAHSATPLCYVAYSTGIFFIDHYYTILAYAHKKLFIFFLRSMVHRGWVLVLLLVSGLTYSAIVRRPARDNLLARRTQTLRTDSPVEEIHRELRRLRRDAAPGDPTFTKSILQDSNPLGLIHYSGYEVRHWVDKLSRLWRSFHLYIYIYIYIYNIYMYIISSFQKEK